MSQGLAKSDRQTTNLFIARNDGEAFGQVAASSNQKVVFLPLEATSLPGSADGDGRW